MNQSLRRGRRIGWILSVAVLLTIVSAIAAPGLAAVQGPTKSELDRPRVALVLGGGAARGFSHIGLLRAMAEEGIPVDMLVGTSMGSIVAGLYASGLSLDNIEYIVTHVELADLFQPVLPPDGGFVRTDRFERFLDIVTDDADFSTLATPFYSVITNVVTGDELALNEGPLSRGIVASMSIPGMFPPVEIDGAYYIDGGIKSPVPVAAALDNGADIVIAVDVRRELDEIDHSNIVTNLQLTLFFMLDANRDWQLEMADVVVAPAVEGDSYMDYDRAAYFISEGYRSAQEALPAMREALLAHDPDFPFGDRPAPAGISQALLQQRVAAGLDEAARDTRAARLIPVPQITLRTDRHPVSQIGLQWPLIRFSDGRAIEATYSLQGSDDGWVHSVGAAYGQCQSLCAGVFARRNRLDDAWHPGVHFAVRAGTWFDTQVEWEARPHESADAWRLDVTAPAVDGVPAGRREYMLSVRRDPRGMSGPSTDHVVAEAGLRWYFPGEMTNILELIRGNASWFVGAGIGAVVDDGLTADAVSPAAEAGVVLEGRLFGLYPLRTRLGLKYTAMDNAWAFRWSFGQ